jgi:hypothetical protein
VALEGGGREFPIVKEFPEGSAVSQESSESEDAGADRLISLIKSNNRKLRGKSTLEGNNFPHSHAMEMGPRRLERA